VYTNGGNGKPGYIKTAVRKGSGDGALLTNGYSTTSSPIAQSVQPLSAHSNHSDPFQALLSVPDTPEWRPYRQFVGMGQQNYLNHIPGTEHLLDANVPQVIKSDLKMAKEIGKGSFGKVSIANWRGTTVAVKELKGNEEQGISPTAPEVLKALQKEASMMAAMRHPNVVLFLGICIESPSLITEYCARGSLYEVIQRWTQGKEVANWLRRLGMILDAAKGMQYLHSCNPPIIHRDLKSPNLLVDKNYNVKICDFNLSKVMECTNSNVTSSLISVNPRWLAPEILKETGYSKASDVYSFGIVMWEMMTWQVPWKDLTTWQIMGMMSNRDNIPRPDIPDRLDCLPGGTFDGMGDYVELMKQCWAEEPDDRPDFPKVASTLRHIMGREASLRRERSDRRNSSLGTDHASSGLFSLGTQPATTDNDSSSDHSGRQ
jgi:serine/threonine protein kinase